MVGLGRRSAWLHRAARSLARAGRGAPRGTALDHDLRVAFLDGLAALVHDHTLDRHDPAIGLGSLPLLGDLQAHLDGVPDLDRSLEPPAETQERQRGKW